MSSTLEDLIEDKAIVNKHIIDESTYEQLNNLYEQFVGSYEKNDDSSTTEDNKLLISNILESISRDPTTGRLIVPALWKKDIEHLLSPNFKLASSILKSNAKRLSKDKLIEYNNVIAEQLNSGVI